MITIHSYPDWDMISDFEVELVGVNGDEHTILYSGYATVHYDHYDRIIYSVYQRFDPGLHEEGFGGVECLADCDSLSEAQGLMEHWQGMLDNYIKPVNEVRKRLKHHPEPESDIGKGEPMGPIVVNG